jgi:hypothetical protein
MLDKSAKFNTLKKFNDKIYTGMAIGGSHHWHYNNGNWFETKKAPDRWTINYKSLKTRAHSAPLNSGANVGTKYHWYLIADQIATKLDSNSYMTSMNGVKFKIGHKRPNWKMFSYNYPEQQSYKERIIEILEHILKKLKE